MHATVRLRAVFVVALMALPFSRAAAQKLTGPGSTVAPPAPVPLDTTGMFRDRFVKVGEDVFIGGQPTEKALRELRAQGVTTVVNLRTPQEMTGSVKFDEAALVQSLGMKYVYLPMRGTKEFPYAPKALRDFTAAMRETDGKLLLHCTIAWRASHLWAAYLIDERHVPVEVALAQTRAINLMDDMRMSEKQPLEEFLGRAVPGLAHPASAVAPPVQPNALAEVQSDYASVRDFFIRAAEKMPEAAYAFKPTPEVRSFAQQVAHVADDQYNLCAPARGEQRKAAYTDIEQRLSKKTELLAALKEAFAYCDVAYGALTDASGAETAAGTSGRTRFGMLNWNLWHTWEHYGNVVVYLRLQGLVPPSSEGMHMKMP